VPDDLERLAILPTRTAAAARKVQALRSAESIRARHRSQMSELVKKAVRSKEGRSRNGALDSITVVQLSMALARAMKCSNEEP